MKIVQKGNKQLRVADDRLQDMLSRGYVEIDAKGKPVAKEPKDEITALKNENKALRKDNKELAEKVEALTRQLEEQSVNPEQ